MRTFSRVLSIVALYGAAGAVGVMGAGCGGGGGGGSGRAAAGATAGNVILTMPSGRAEHSATLLQTGEVLVAGGIDISGDPVATSVIIGASSVRPGPDLSSPRVGHTATLLTNGQVLIAGGSSDAAGATVLDTTELFDPVTSTFVAGPNLAQARTRHAAMSYVRAQGEFVLFAGGSSGLNQATPPAPVLLDSCEVLDVATSASAAITAKLAAPQANARAARLDTGGILIVGGEAAQGAAAAQIFDPAARTFSSSNVVVARTGAAVASRGREVLVAGGQSATGLEDSTEVFDSATRTFSQGVRLGAARRDAAIASVGTNDMVIAGGRSAQGVVGMVEKLSGTTLGQSQVSAIQPLTSARAAHTATGISGTKLVVVGGYDAQGVVLATVEVIDLAAPPPASTGTTTPGTTTGGVLPGGLPSVPTTTTPGTTNPGTTNPGTTNPGTGTGSGSGSGSGGLGGLLGGLFGGGSSSGSGGSSLTSTLLNAALQAAVQALTSSSGSGFSGFFSAFIQNFMNNMLAGLFGGSGSSGSSGSGLSGLLSSLLGSLTGGSGSSGSSSSGLSGILSSLLGSLTGGSSSGSSGGLSGLLSGLFGGGSSGSSGSSSGGLSGLLSGLFGGGSSGSTSSGTTAAPTISGMTPGSGPVGTQVLISGANFGTQVSVAFNGVNAPVQNSVTSSGQTILYVNVPQGATSGNVTVTTNGQTVVAGAFTVQ